MWRHRSKPRPGFLRTVEQQGLIFPETDLPDGSKVPYWNEWAWYELTQSEVDLLEHATETLWGLCLEAVPKMLRDFDDADLRLPRGTLDLVRDSIRAEHPSLYARFDLRFDGEDLRMMELNGDTPTGLVETAVAQWRWKEDMDFSNDTDQWNSLHERL
ncbi:MAG: ygiC, partial [Marmoricola sp.]|nr:ygiC [Marmoricola sp.]